MDKSEQPTLRGGVKPPEKPMTFHELEEMMMGPPDATQLARGVTLFTVDGSRIGNAIVVKKIGQGRRIVSHDDIGKDNLPLMQDIWLIETDFGNSCRMSDREIFSHFTLGKQHDYDKWWDDRLATIQKTVEQS